MQHTDEHKPDHDGKFPEQPNDKGFSIVVNGRKKTVEEEELTFDQVVGLAYDNPPTGEFICFTITYRNAGGRKPEGTLVEGQVVKVRDGTILNVSVTDKS